MHGITVVCHHRLSCCIYTVLVSLIFATIPTSFNILMKKVFALFVEVLTQRISTITLFPFHRYRL